MRLYPLLAGLLVGALAVSTGCGGGGGGGSSGGTQGNVSVLIKDSPLLAINGHNFSELNVDLLSFEASVPGTRAFTPMTLVSGVPARINLLDLSNDQDWLAVASLPVGSYDTFRLTIDTATASLTENGTGSTQALAMHANNPNGVLEIHMHPPLAVTTATAQQHLLLIDWDAQHSVSFARNPTPTGTYFLSGNFIASAVNRAAAPLSFRSLPGRLTAVDTATGDMRIRLERDNRAAYLVRTNPGGTTPAPAVLETMTGSALLITDFAAGDFVTITGTVDGNTDIDASVVRKLTASNAVPPGGPGGGHNGNNNNGGGHGNNGGNGNGNGGNGNGGNGNGGPGNGGNNGPVAPVVFAVGAVGSLDLAANTFVLSTGRGPITVTYSDTGAFPTEIFDATVRPPRLTNENGLTSTNINGTVIVEVVGLFVAPTQPNQLPTIDATKASGPPGRIAILRRQ